LNLNSVNELFAGRTAPRRRLWLFWRPLPISFLFTEERVTDGKLSTGGRS
jgi:hypothetical protein